MSVADGSLYLNVESCVTVLLLCDYELNVLVLDVQINFTKNLLQMLMMFQQLGNKHLTDDTHSVQSMNEKSTVVEPNQSQIFKGWLEVLRDRMHRL